MRRSGVLADVQAGKSAEPDTRVAGLDQGADDQDADTQAIRALDGPASGLPIIALTANADPDDARRYVDIGMACVVEKPIKPERLRLAMNTALGAGEAAAKGATNVRSVA